MTLWFFIIIVVPRAAFEQSYMLDNRVSSRFHFSEAVNFKKISPAYSGHDFLKYTLGLVVVYPLPYLISIYIRNVVHFVNFSSLKKKLVSTLEIRTSIK
jgi:hypothetical protein